MDVPAATPVDRESTRTSSDAATKFCKEWPWNEQLKDAPIGTRNVLAAFYLLEMLRKQIRGVSSTEAGFITPVDSRRCTSSQVRSAKMT